MNEKAANERGLPSKPGLPVEKRSGDVHASTATHSSSPTKG